MQDVIIVHYMTKTLDAFLAGVAEKMPLAPLDSVRRNVLLMSQNGGRSSILQDFCAHYFDMIKEAMAAPDPHNVRIYNNQPIFPVEEFTMDPGQATNIVIGSLEVPDDQLPKSN